MFSLDAAMKVLKPFHSNPLRSYYLREISRNCDFSYERVHAWANEMEKEGLLVSEKRGKIKEYKINKASEMVAKIFALHDVGKKNRFFEKKQPVKNAVSTLKNKLVERVSEPINSILILDKGAAGRSEIAVHILANQPLSPAAYSEVEKICRECSKAYNFLIYFDTIHQFKAKWVDDKEYRKMWLTGILLHGEENFWREFLKIENKMETTI